jgi:phage-related protein
MKDALFLGDALKRLQGLPEAAKKDLGHALLDVQLGEAPADWKPLPGMPAGVKELRVKNDAGAFRAIYIVKPAAVLLLNVFQKKSQAAPKPELDLAKARLKAWERAQ